MTYLKGICRNVGQVFVNFLGIKSLLQINLLEKYLGLPNPEMSKGHCFLRTSASLLVDGGGYIKKKRQGRWRSTTVSEGYSRNQKLIYKFYKPFKFVLIFAPKNQVYLKTNNNQNKKSVSTKVNLMAGFCTQVFNFYLPMKANGHFPPRMRVEQLIFFKGRRKSFYTSWSYVFYQRGKIHPR